MPGMQVDTDGTITAQGEQVQRVMVDGREFFGRDPKLATRNLPADAVDKVQVFDKKSDQAVFTGIEDGQREKTINLELKEEKRHGAFGNLMAGAGTEDRFQAKASVNKFAKGDQLSFLGMGNNVNEQGFSLDDYMNFSGGSQQMGGAGGGPHPLTEREPEGPSHQREVDLEARPNKGILRDREPRSVLGARRQECIHDAMVARTRDGALRPPDPLSSASTQGRVCSNYGHASRSGSARAPSVTGSRSSRLGSSPRTCEATGSSAATARAKRAW